MPQKTRFAGKKLAARFLLVKPGTKLLTGASVRIDILLKLAGGGRVRLIGCCLFQH